jgi:maleate cis-trans isomerase
MTPYSKGVACQFVELVTCMSAAIAALDAMSGNDLTILTPPVEETNVVSTALNRMN